MADKVTISRGERPEVVLRPQSPGLSVVARPVAIGTPGISVAKNDTDALLRSLDYGIAQFNQTAKQVNAEERERQFKEGQLAQEQSQKDWATAVADGTVPQTANPWFIKGYQNQEGRVAGLSYYSEMRKAYASSEAKGSDDPKVFEKFMSDFTREYQGKLGKDRSTDFWDGFKTVSDTSKSQLTSEHARDAEQAVVAKQEANTGAEINSILNSTTDPIEAAKRINELGAKMKLDGMPPQAFEKVAAEAVLAKSKLGNSNFLKALDHITTGDKGATLASNPKVVTARVDTENWIKEKQRGDVRWAWANDDRQWTLQQRKLAEEAHKRELERWDHQKAEWGRAEQSRSKMTQIMLKGMSDPASAYVNTREDILELAKLNPQAAESVSNFLDAFTTKRERVTDAVERPVIAQLQQDMISSAGDPMKMQQLLFDANKMMAEGKLNKDTMMRFIDDAQKFSSWDPSTQRKLQDPELVRVRQAAKEVYMAKGATSLYGSSAIDALVTEQVINKAVLDYLKTKPNATGQELAEVGTRALQSVLPTLNPNIMGDGKANALGGQARTAADNIQRTGPQDGNTPPAAPAMTPDQKAAAISREDAQAAITSFNEAFQKGGAVGIVQAMRDFDERTKSPGLAEALLKKYQTQEGKK